MLTLLSPRTHPHQKQTQQSIITNWKFSLQSAVLSCCFSPYQPNILVGGTYSGQVVLWDQRVAKKTPVQRSSLSSTPQRYHNYCANSAA